MSNTLTSEQPTRASRSGNQGSRADNTANRPPSSLVFTGADRAGSPAEALAVASVMKPHKASCYLYTELAYQGLSQFDLGAIPTHAHIEPWITQYTRVAENLNEFSFEQWKTLIRTIDRSNSIGMTEWHEDFLTAIRTAPFGWSDPQDRLRVQFWLLGRLWPRTKNLPHVFGMVQDLLSDFENQSEEEQQSIRALWHTEGEEEFFNILPDNVVLSRIGQLPEVLAGFTYKFPARSAEESAARNSQLEMKDDKWGWPFIYCRLVPKSRILGVKNPGIDWSDMEAVASPCIPGEVIR